MTDTDAKLLIDLDAPQDGIIPAELRNIHKDELERVAGWVTERATEARAHYAPQGRRSEAPGRHSQTAAAWFHTASRHKRWAIALQPRSGCDLALYLCHAKSGTLRMVGSLTW